MDRGNKSVWYKRAQHTLSGQTLQSLLNSALAALADPFQRLWAPNGEQGDKFAINGFTTFKGALAGQFVCFEPGQRQPIITLASGNPSFDITAITAGAAGKEFLEGICYFLIFQDHILFVNSKALGTKEFERYVLWLLAEATKTIDPTAVVSISDQPPTATQRKVANKKLRGVTFGTPLRPTATPAVVDGKSMVVYKADAPSWEGLRGFLGSKVIDKLKLTQALDEAQLEVQVTVRVKGARTVSSDAHKMLGELAKAARHFDPEDVEMEVQGVGVVKGDEMKIHKSFSVKLHESGGLVDEGELWQKVLDWLRQMIDDGTVPA